MVIGVGDGGFGGYVIERIPEIPVPVSKAELGAIKSHRFPIRRRCVENPLRPIHLLKGAFIEELESVSS